MRCVWCGKNGARMLESIPLPDGRAGFIKLPSHLVHPHCGECVQKTFDLVYDEVALTASTTLNRVIGYALDTK